MAVFPELRAERLRHRRPAAAGHPAGRGRGGRRRAGRGDRRPAAGARRRRAARARHPAAQLRRRHPPRAGCSASRRSPTCRPTASSTSGASSPRATTARRLRIRLGGDDVPFGPDLVFEAADVPGLRLHVEVCEDMWVPIPPSAEAALAGATVLANLSGSPITIGSRRGPAAAGPLGERALQRGLPLRRRGPGRVDHRPVVGRPDAWSTSAATCWPSPSGSPTGRGAASPTSTSTGSARSGCGRAPSTTTGAPHDERDRGEFRVVELRARPARRRHRAAPQGRPLPVRARRPRAARAGLLRGLQHPGLRAGAAAARDRRSRRSSSASPAGSTPPTR